MDRPSELLKFDQTTTDMMRQRSAMNPTRPFDLQSWRSVLVHLRTNYPVGVMGRLTSVKFNEDLDEAQTSLLGRVKTMKDDLKEVIEFKQKKIAHSRFGKTLQSSLLLQEGCGDSSISASELTLNEEDEEDDEPEKLNVYADLILSGPTKHKEHGGIATGDTDDASLATYDDFSLAGDRKTAGTTLLALQQSIGDGLNAPSSNMLDVTGFLVGGSGGDGDVNDERGEEEEE